MRKRTAAPSTRLAAQQYILSAVLHADERNKALSEELGRDVYHYHLHVVYVPVVEKREYFRRKKDEPEDAPRKLKAVYTQISHAKKWPGKMPVERGGTTIENLDEKITVREKAKATLAEINAMGKPAILGGVNFTDAEAKKLKSLARKGVGIDKRAADYREKIAALDSQIRDLGGEINDWKRSYQTAAQERDAYKHNYDRLWAEVKPFIDAIRKAPQMLLDFIRERMTQPQQQHKYHSREAR